MVWTSDRYYYIWRNKFLTMDAQTIDGMIEGLESALHELREMRSRGVVLDGGAEDDCAYLVTSDPEVASSFGFELEESFSEQEDPESNQSLAEQVAAECGLEVIEP